ncbi:MAG TPA: cupin domain-containing protein, partial [Acidimicrobiia bacterium]|nr:cupin domain-containing protein [Acidimicrobiia bacterium]
TGYGVVGCSRSLPLSAERPEPHPDDPGLRDWRLDAGEGDQAPLHVHHGGEEAFICLDGHLEVEVDGYATTLSRERSSWFLAEPCTPSLLGEARTSSL